MRTKSRKELRKELEDCNTNLWKETLLSLKKAGKTFADVLYIQGSDFAITKETFEQIAKKSNYYAGFGHAEVATDLVLVGDNWWLERYDSGGVERWVYKEKPKFINDFKDISQLTEGIWETLAEINNIKVENNDIAESNDIK